ncbi:protein ACCELERATED CELL DEATH 6 [Gossypium raimondii]|nr:protein ACCELERATED CELL DEATH 6 [Gossypium raimondii]
MAQDSCIIIPSQQPQPPVEAITFMECDSLKAAEDGDMLLFNKYHGDLHYLENSEASGSWWRTMLRMKDKADNTAFHMAVECPPDDIDVVRLLVKELELDPEFSLSANKSGETPLYIAAMTSYATDKKGRTPIHYTANFGNYSAVEQLLEMDASAAYVRDEERKMTALHMAAWGSDVHRTTIQNFLYGKDVNGNTPLDVFSMFLHSGPSAASSNVLTSLELEKREILKEIGNNAGEEGIRHHKSFRENMGNDNNPSTLKEVVDKLRETHLLVAALVATVAFTAANAVPGGYKADDKGTVDEGTAILSQLRL